MDLATAVETVEKALDALGRAELDDTTATELRELLVRMKRCGSKLDAQLGRLTFAADRSGAFIGTGARDSAEWLAGQTGTSARRNRSAAELGEAMAKSDDLADAIASGAISSDTAAAIIGAARDEPIDADLLDTVADLPLDAVRPLVEQWRARTNPEREANVADVQRNARCLRLTSRADGMTRLDGLLDPESAAVCRATLDGVMHLSHDDGTGRTREQRCADALTQLCSAASKGRLRGGRSNTKLLATVPFDTITERAAARGVTHVGPTIDAATVRKLACDAGIHRVITGPASSILDFGHATHLVPDNLYWALVARDQRCRWPGCDVRATWCDAHHIREFTRQNGPTDDDNCVLLCHRHHQLSHQPGWSVTGTGLELSVHHPDGTIHISRPPGADPPDGDASRAGPTGRELPGCGVPTPHDTTSTSLAQVQHEQLTLA